MIDSEMENIAYLFLALFKCHIMSFSVETKNPPIKAGFSSE